MTNNKNWVPEIVYADSDDGENQLGSLPMVHCPTDQEMPKFLLIWEVRSTGTFEPGLSGEEVPVVDQELKQYARMDVLKEKLTPPEFDRIRLALGLKPLAEAAKAGQVITQKVRENVAQKELAVLGKKSM